MEEFKTILIVGLLILMIIVLGCLISKSLNKDSKKNKSTRNSQIEGENIETLVEYIKTQKEEAEAEKRLKELKKADLKQKLETFKQTKEQLKNKLKSQINSKSWKPLKSILNSADKGGVGIYILHNKNNNKYYIGQAKQIFKRIREHFSVEEIAMDYLNGDSIEVKFLTANELDSDYRLDHIEKTSIELFESDKKGYNKTSGNL